jgi:hypothetical protein
MRIVWITLLLGLVSGSLHRPRAVRPTTPEVYKRQALEADVPAETESGLKARWDVQQASERENATFAPIPDFWSEETNLGPITFRRRLHAGMASTVFHVFEHPNIIIKYEVDCLRDAPDEFHPLFRDYHYMHGAAQIGIAPPPLFISPPSLICESKQGKCEFTMADAQFRSCRADNATMRYMLMEKAQGLSLHAFRSRVFDVSNGAMGLRNSLVIGAALIDMIHVLHREAKIVHGDVHSPNIMIQLEPETNLPNLQFIDFGYAFAFPDAGLSESRDQSRRYRHPSRTHWQMEGFASAPRDDVLKALQTIAQITHSFDYLEFENRLGLGGLIGSPLLSWKTRANWFTDPPFDVVAGLRGISDSTKTELRERLLEVLNLVRGLGINDPIPYEYIADELRECAHLTTFEISGNTTIAPV